MRDLEIVQFGVTIENVLTYYVKCGCKTFVFMDKGDLQDFLNAYMADPDGYEKKWYEKNENNTIEQGMAGENVRRPPTIESRTAQEEIRSLGNTLRNR